VHFIEGENLHRRSGQDIQHMRVIRKHIEAGDLGPGANRILRQRLGNYYKAEGDNRRASGAPGAWQSYLRSLRTWPFDPVVAVRCVAWLPGGFRELLASGPADDPSR
jgi:hypothetical protein